MNGSRRLSLFLMEQLLTILFFALTTAACVQIFAAAQTLTVEGWAQDQAALTAQSAAEVYKATHGDLQAVAAILNAELDAGGIRQCYDADWQPCAMEGAAFTLSLTEAEQSIPLLRQATVAVSGPGGEPLILFDISVQEAAL